MKKKYLIPGIILILLCLGFTFLLLKRILPAKQPDTIHQPSPSADAALASPSPAPSTPTPSATPMAKVDVTPSPEPTPEESPEPTPETTPEPVESSPARVTKIEAPDFDALAAQNADIYAWIDIPGAGISYAVLQSATDDTIYLDHEEHGWYSANGSLFTEHVYNSKDFTDPVTIIYGHHMRSGAMFGNMQTFYSSTSNFQTYNDIYIYLPGQELHYHIFAAIPFDGYHILYAHDFTDTRTFTAFFDKVMATRVLGSNIDSECELSPDDKVIILSTCLQGNNKNRFLVMAKQVD